MFLKVTDLEDHVLHKLRGFWSFFFFLFVMDFVLFKQEDIKI